MKLAICYDTETQCLPLYKERSHHPDQPHIVQLAAHLVDLNERKVVSTMNLIVKPEGWEIPEETAAIHGITTEMAMDVGIPEEEVLNVFMSLWNRRLRIAHNDAFDARIIRIGLKRFFPDDEMLIKQWEDGGRYCTLLKSKPIIKLPPTEKMKKSRFKNSFKPPNLGEAYKFFTGNNLEGAHNALVDIDACLAVYYGIQDRDMDDIMPF